MARMLLERVFACEDDAIDAQPIHHARAALVVHRGLRAAVNFQLRVELADEAHGAEVLHDGGIDTAIDALAEIGQRLRQFVRLHQHVERQIDAGAMRMRDGAGLGQFPE